MTGFIDIQENYRSGRSDVKAAGAALGSAFVKELVYHRFLLPTAERLASKTATLDGDFTATYAEHVDRVLRLSSGLATELGTGRGDRFAVMALNGHQFLELYHASFLGGAVINPLNLRLAPKELEFIMKDSGCKVCFADPFFAPAVDRVREAAGLEKVVLIGSATCPTTSDTRTWWRPAVPPCRPSRRRTTRPS